MGGDMKDFPEFMKQPANRIATRSQATPGVEGFVFDGLDGSQMAFWTCSETPRHRRLTFTSSTNT